MMINQDRKVTLETKIAKMEKHIKKCNCDLCEIKYQLNHYRDEYKIIMDRELNGK